MTPIDGIDDAVQVAVGLEFTCVLQASGHVLCWGANYLGKLGDGTTRNRHSPARVVHSGESTGGALPERERPEPVSDLVSIMAGAFHTCARTLSGGSKCWGENTSGELGNGNYTASPVGMSVAGLDAPVSRVTAGFEHTCTLLEDTSLHCWGSNSFGQLRLYDETEALAFPLELDASGIRDADADDATTCALEDDGVFCWSDVWASWWDVDFAADVERMEVGTEHVCMLMSDSSVRCVGDNSTGQIGTADADVAYYAEFVEVLPATFATSLDVRSERRNSYPEPGTPSSNPREDDGLRRTVTFRSQRPKEWLLSPLRSLEPRPFKFRSESIWNRTVHAGPVPGGRAAETTAICTRAGAAGAAAHRLRIGCG